MEERRRHLPPLTDDDVDRIAEAITLKAREAFHVEEEKHYNDHQRLDRLLDAYEGARNMFWKSFLGLVIMGMILLAGTVAVKGMK